MNNVRDYNVGKSDYSKHKIQPWDIWLEYGLNPWDADIVKRVLRTKDGEDRKLDYEKIIHICRERIRQLEAEHTGVIEESDEPGYKTAILPAEKADYKTVICPSEKDKPELRYSENACLPGVIRVYSVFQSDGRPYAYLGCRGKTHVYLDLGTKCVWAYIKYDWMPRRSFGIYNTPLNKEDHAVSMELGTYGVSYEKHDYIISFGHLYRYMDATPEGHVYMRFEDDGSFTKGVSKNKIFNEAVQYVKGNNK